MTESKTASTPVPLDRPRPDEAAPDQGLAVLVIADEPARTPVLASALDDRAAGPLRVTPCALPTAVSTRLADGPFDCILLTLERPADRWIETLAQVRAAASDLPVVVYTERDDAALGRALIAAGAEDWLCAADQDARLLTRTLRHAVERQRLRRQQLRRAEAADLVDQRESEQREVGRLLGGSRHAGQAARIYGAATLRDSNPGLFEELLEDYLGLIEHTAASQVFRLRPEQERSARPLAERLGFMGAGPRDVIELHTEALRRLAQRVGPAQEHQVAVEGRIVVLELMGYLASYYRRYYLSRQSLAVDPADAPDHQPG
ncbi:response regulator [uncultured Thiodictyon sp.]|uniref:response regulator n=1 Tax=uncultured Thiodictyon sp. TaxID=1846217 RepID=UPI0025E63B1E|nr:response regulator [uncultured Thiodictyon sp.]